MTRRSSSFRAVSRSRAARPDRAPTAPTRRFALGAGELGSLCAVMFRSQTFWLVLLVSWLASRPSSLKADGAFADSQTILISHTHPHRIIASSDISGLLVSDDDGATWSWICEDAIGYFAALFQLGPAPDENLYAITEAGLSVSIDAGCSWQHAPGIAQHAGDVFADPSDPQRVLAVAQVDTLADSHVLSDIVAASNDGGLSFGPAMYMTSVASITGVEIARSDPNAIYLTMSSLQQQHPYIARSQDAGATWMQLDLSSQLGRKPLVMRIVAVDPVDANTLYLRLSDGVQDALAITHDAGTTVQVALQLDSSMSAFLLRSDGALIVASADAMSFISSDAGASFSPWSNDFHIHALAENNGALYATANSKADGFSVAVSADGGGHWKPLLRLDQLRGPVGCGAMPKQCDLAWTQLQPTITALSGKPSAAAGASALNGESPAASESADSRRSSGGCSVSAALGNSSKCDAAPIWLLACAALSGGVRAAKRGKRVLSVQRRRRSRSSNQENET
jgi:hypothetical protein